MSTQDVETKALKQAFCRNKDLCADDFMFVLNDAEIENMMSQNVISSKPRPGVKIANLNGPISS